ncbi:MAG: hypothetical protein R6V19_09045, partial [Armatimonadota bacterium]
EISSAARLADVTWAAEGDMLQDERQARRTENPEDRLELLQQCTAVYRQIKQNYQNSGDYQRAGDFSSARWSASARRCLSPHPPILPLRFLPAFCGG